LGAALGCICKLCFAELRDAADQQHEDQSQQQEETVASVLLQSSVIEMTAGTGY